jgi:hypothetical protein
MTGLGKESKLLKGLFATKKLLLMQEKESFQRIQLWQ